MCVMVIKTVVYVLCLSGYLKFVHGQLEPHTLDEFLNGSLRDYGWNGSWISDSDYIAKDTNNNYYKINVNSSIVELFVNSNDLNKYKRNHITPSSNFKYILIRHNTKAIFRHSTASQYTVYDIENKRYHDLENKEHLQLAQWVPKSTSLVYVYDNNIYYIPSVIEILQPKQITTDGVRGIIFNGIADWVYEEEVLSSGIALWFSPNGKRLAFATFDDSNVEDYHYLIYNEPGNMTSQYPSVVSIKYPKAGTQNPTVALKYVNLDDPLLKVTELNIIPLDVVSSDHILNDVSWANNDIVVAVSLNRTQNIAAVVKCNVKAPLCYKMYTSEQSKGWLAIKTPTFFNKGSHSFILNAEPEENDFYRHLSLVKENDVAGRRRLTYGKRVILSVYGVDENKHLVYYLSTLLNKPNQEHVYAFDFKNNVEYCVTCSFMVPQGFCNVASAAFSKGFSYITKICHGPGPKIVQIQNLMSGEFFLWETNSALYKKLKSKLQPITKTLKVPLKRNFYALVRLLLPPGLDELSNKKYPMIVNVYSGPNTNRVTDRYSSGIENYFVTKRNYVYAYIDGRGCGRSGNKILFDVYRNLGDAEPEDQIEVTKYLQRKFNFIDKTNIGIWGWSYGGFTTLHSLIKDTENVFKAGVAVAPLISFLYYDSIYSERYMGLPTTSDNIEGYKNADILNQVEGLRNKTFYIIHGNADDNVHYQQSMLLSKILERADIMFFQQSYPDENHSLGRVKRHLYHTIDNFFYQHLNPGHSKKVTFKKKKLLHSTVLYQDVSRNVNIFDVSQNMSLQYLNNSVFVNYPGSSISFSKDLKFGLLRYNETSIFRHSRTAEYAVYDITNKLYYNVHNKTQLQFAQWGPKNNALVYVHNNNIYYASTANEITNPRQITTDGKPGIVYNGVPDWVYEEEVLGSGSALWFSPDGDHLAFAHFNDTKVNDFHYFIYGKSTNQYPALITLKYPKVGTTNPSVEIKFVNLNNPVSSVIDLKDIVPMSIASKDYIIQAIKWANSSDIVGVLLNRVQNVVGVVRCNIIVGKCNDLYSFNETKGWVELTAPFFNKDGSKYLMITSEAEGNDSYKHLSLIENFNFSQRTRLTFGKRIVSSIYGWDELQNFVYYVGSVEGRHDQQQVYVINLDNNKDHCLTCNFMTQEGPCTVSSASFSKEFTYYTRICSGPGPKTVQIFNLKTSNYYNWEDNKDLRNRLSKKLKPTKISVKVPLSNGFVAHARLLLPPKICPNAREKYPAIVNVYGGPNSNQISDAYSAGIENYFVTNRKYIYIFIDGRGSGRNGDNLMFAIYRKLGTVEIADQIEVTKYLQEKFQFIDSDRTGIWGWSYGGFSTLHVIAQDTKQVFKFGLAVAPVTNFILYDSIYTERYMGLNTIEDNMEGYNNTDLSRVVEAFRNKTFYVIHGNADDNVHYQQSMLFVKALERADVMFFQQNYPDENHNLGSVYPHLYHTIDKFFDHGIRSGSMLYAMFVTLIGATLNPFHLSEILGGSFNDRKWNGTWISDSVFWYKDEENNVCIYDANKNTNIIYLPADVCRQFMDCALTFSDNMNYLLIKHGQKLYTVYDVFNRKYYHMHDHEDLQNVAWVPNSTGLVYVHKNNIYYAFNVSQLSTPRQLTHDGAPGLVYNGIVNYIYRVPTLYFSPNGDRLVFAHFDDTNVSDFHYLTYGESNDQYPTLTTIKYPKVGKTNPKVILKYVDLNSYNDPVDIKNIIDVKMLTEDYVYKDATWANNDNIVEIFMNRVQNTTTAVRCNMYTVSVRNGWVTLSSPIFSKNGSMYLMITPEEEENDFYNHLTLIHNGSVSGKYGSQQVFVFNLNTNTEFCLTCQFVIPEGHCKFASAEFSDSSSYAAVTCNGPGPTVVKIQNLESLRYIEWENNINLRKNIFQKLLPVQKNLKVTMKKSYNVHVRLLLPPELNKNADVKYPMIVYVYGAPDSHLISEEYSTGLENYFVTNRRYVYAFIDGRGTEENGNVFMFQIYKRLGSVEVEDQIEVTRYLLRHYRFIDDSRTGIWGGSYGGFVTLMALAKDTKDVFKCGLSVAPVTNFIHFMQKKDHDMHKIDDVDDNTVGDNDYNDNIDYHENQILCVISDGCKLYRVVQTDSN
ncbi:hypothetical protein FQR65_LT06588 [Abscondita terminalis]|nr:hypothetical protein FQR65_LT06588 [Abscondita terminalis]